MSTLVPPHEVVKGPLAVRWLAYDLPPQRAGAETSAHVEVENAGSGTWRSEGEGAVHVSYHWLDPLGNALVWGGVFTAIPEPIAPGKRAELELSIRAPIPPGRYRLDLDLVADGLSWFSQIGNPPLSLETEVGPRITDRRIAVTVRPGADRLVAITERALAGQKGVVRAQEAPVTAHLAAGCRPDADWSHRVLDAHAEGYAAVGGSIEPAGSFRERRSLNRVLAPWAPGSGRNPRFAYPLLCPSFVSDLDAWWTESVAGLPALVHPPVEPWIYDGRIRIVVRP